MFRFLLTASFGGLCLLFWQFSTDQRPIAIAQLADASQYRGDMVDGILNGTGELKNSDGSFYRGQFKNGLYHGQGRIDYADGSYYMGDFDAGYFHGQGIYQDDSGRYQGHFVKGDLTGAGSFESFEGEIYSGQFTDWLFQGKGQYTDPQGNRWVGEFIEGELNGEGEFFGIDGTVYTGEFNAWRYQGQGRLISQGDIYQGAFFEDYYHGQGTLIYGEAIDGVTKLEGIWQYGELVQGEHASAPVTELAEELLYEHYEHFQRDLNLLSHSRPGVREIYFLGIAGDGSQGVFRREIQTISRGLEHRGIGPNKQLLLINARDNMGKPLATRRSIQESLSALSNKMHPEEDLLVIYMTSHGSANHEFSLKQPGIELADLPAQDLGKWINQLPVKHKVIIVSACYSGGFIPHLAADSHLVVSAAAADKTSFGCTDRGSMTWFGEAYFKDTIFAKNTLSGMDFIDAFQPATTLIEEKEKAGNIPASAPQLSRGIYIDSFLSAF